MWTSIAAAAIAAGTSIYGAISKSRQAAKEYRANQKVINNARRENGDYYNNGVYSDATQLADNRAMLTEAADRLRRSSNAAAGSQAVNGATNATAAAQKETNNQSYAGLIRDVSANAQQRKNAVQDNYLQNQMKIAQGQMNLNTSRNEANAAAIDTAVQGVGKTASSIIEASDGFKAKN